MAKKKSVTQRKTLTQQEKQILRNLKKKLNIKDRKKLTQKIYLDFLKRTKKANDKLDELGKSGGFLGDRSKLSPKIENAKTIDELDKWLKRPDIILQDDYEKSVNEWYREQLITNIRNAFGDSLGIEDLTYEQISDMINRNPHFSFLLQYHRGNELQENLDLFNISEDDIAEAIREEMDYYNR
jgi:hypothetical protein